MWRGTEHMAPGEGEACIKVRGIEGQGSAYCFPGRGGDDGPGELENTCREDLACLREELRLRLDPVPVG